MTDDDRLPTALWVDAQLKTWTMKGGTYYIAHKGDCATGSILLKINTLTDGCLVLQQQRDLNGQLGWMTLFKGATVPEGEADAYIKRAVERDSDLWAIEVEDKERRNPFEGKIF